jgi:hypothetical protein
MTARLALRIRLSRVATTFILLAFAVMGLLAGLVAHSLAHPQSPGALASGPVISGSPPGQAAPTETSTLTDATATATTTNIQTGFTLSISLSQRSVSAGDTFTVTVTATANGAPVSGLSCALRSPTNGPQGLLTTWPAPVVTDANGKATWTLTTPAVAPGAYGVEVDAAGAHHYEFHRYASIQVS